MGLGGELFVFISAVSEIILLLSSFSFKDSAVLLDVVHPPPPPTHPAQSNSTKPREK
jgi:hypothetical protein